MIELPGSVVFFGMDGAFSSVALSALANGGLRPSLVIQGVRGGRWEKRHAIEDLPARPGALQRWLGAPVPRGLIAAAHALGADGARTNDAAAPETFARIKSARPGAIVVAGFPFLLPAPLVALPARGGLNVHPGRLPSERGPSPVFWALKAGRASFGWTVHVLDDGEDSGDIVAAGEVDAPPGAREQQILEQLAIAAAPHLVRAVRGLLAGEIVRQPQPRIGASRRSRPRGDDNRIDPSVPAEAVYRFVEGCAASHVLFVECGGDRFYVRAARAFDPAGTLPSEYYLSGDTLLLACTPGTVELELREDGAVFSAEY